MNEVIEIQIVATLRLLISIYILFYWIPRKIFPQEYIDDPIDQVMFNIIHMAAVVTLVFPIFIYLRIFGLPFLLFFSFGVRLLFVKFWYKKSLLAHLGNSFYHPLIMKGLILLEKGRENLTTVRQWVAVTWQRFRFGYNPLQFFAVTLIGIVGFYAIFIRLYGPYTSMVAVASDMYQYFFWNKILKVNQLFHPVAGAPYPWGGPVLVFTANMFANLDSVVLCTIFAFIILSLAFFIFFYCCRKLFDPEGKGTATAVLVILLFGVIIPSPWAQAFVGTVFETAKPDVLHFSLFKIYTGARQVTDIVYTNIPFILFNRYTASLPYEMAASFFPLNLYFLMKLFIERSRLYLLLYGETLGIILAIHPGVAIPLFFPSVLIVGYMVLSVGMKWKFMKEFLIALCAIFILGNLWIVQFLIYGLPRAIGAALPILDKIFQTGLEARLTMPTAIKTMNLVTPSLFLFVLFLTAAGLLAGSFIFRDKSKRFSLAWVALTAIGTLVLYGETNWGFPRLVDHSRLLVFLVISYALTAAAVYRLIVEELILGKVFKKWAYHASLTVMAAISLIFIIVTPRWIDTKYYWSQINDFELQETPYLVYKIREIFQPFTYTVVSYVEEFSQVYGSGYHMNTHDFIIAYNPLDQELKVPTGYIFIFVENKPVTFKEKGGEYWYQWRREIMLKLKDWVALYGTSHDNMKLWFSNPDLQVYVIDNVKSHDTMTGRLEKIEDKGR